MKRLNFINRFENWIFKRYNGDHQPISAYVAATTLVGAFVGIILVFILKWTGNGRYEDSLFYFVIGITFLITVYKTISPIKSVAGIGAKIGYAVYILFLYSITMAVFATLTVVLVFVVAGLLALYILSLFISDDGKGKKTATIRWSDGRTEEAEQTGRGITGERFYKGKDSGKEITV